MKYNPKLDLKARQERYLLAHNCILFNTELSLSARMLYIYMINTAEKTGEFFESISNTSSNLGIPVRTLKRIRKELENYKLIKINTKNGSGSRVTFLAHESLNESKICKESEKKQCQNGTGQDPDQCQNGTGSSKTSAKLAPHQCQFGTHNKLNNKLPPLNKLNKLNNARSGEGVINNTSVDKTNDDIIDAEYIEVDIEDYEFSHLDELPAKISECAQYPISAFDDQSDFINHIDANRLNEDIANYLMSIVDENHRDEMKKLWYRKRFWHTGITTPAPVLQNVKSEYAELVWHNKKWTRKEIAAIA